MNSRKVYLGMLGAVAILILAILGGTYGTSKLLEQRSTALANLKAKSAQLNDEQASLKKDKQDVATYQPLADIAKSIVPQDKDQAEAVREIVNLANASGISMSSASITFPESTLGGSTTSAAPSTPAKPSANSGLSQLKPVKGIPGVYDLEITIQQNPDNPVPYSSFVSFLGRLEHNRRTAQVNSITLLPDDKNPGLLSFTLVLDTYIKP